MYITLYKVQLPYISHHLHTGPNIRTFYLGEWNYQSKIRRKKKWRILDDCETWTEDQPYSRTITGAISSNVPKPLEIHNRTVSVVHARYTSWQDSALL